MDTPQAEFLQDRVDATIREILANYENCVGSFRSGPNEATAALAAALSAAIETLPQARLRERLLAEVRHVLADELPALAIRG